MHIQYTVLNMYTHRYSLGNELFDTNGTFVLFIASSGNCQSHHAVTKIRLNPPRLFGMKIVLILILTGRCALTDVVIDMSYWMIIKRLFDVC